MQKIADFEIISLNFLKIIDNAEKSCYNFNIKKTS